MLFIQDLLMSNVPVAVPLDGPLWPWLLRASLTMLRKTALSSQQINTAFALGPAPLLTLPAYRSLLGFSDHLLPLCWFYPFLQKAQLASMLQIPSLPVVGLIHLRNTLQLTSIGQTAMSAAMRRANSHVDSMPSEMTQHTGALRWSVHTQLRLNPHEGDWLLSAEQQLYQDGSFNLLLQGRSEYLVQKGAVRPQRPPLPALKSATLLQQWDCQHALARRYAALSGDWNPIHLWHWSARLFGQPAVLLHGMASAALLEARLPKPASHLQLEFIKPVRPGTTLQLRQASPSEYWLCSQDRLCLRAEVG